MIGNVPLPYQFTLVKYYLSIDGIPWVIFSNLNDALYNEFKEGFFGTLNAERKDRWGFEQVAWLSTPHEYDVDTPYSDTWLSIFEASGETSREVRPFVYNDDHLRVHRNGAAVYSEEKKLIFLLPLIVQAHHLLPDMPIFWANDNSPLSLYKSYTWMHEDTSKWLAETGAHYPSALRPQIQPRIEALRTWQPGRRQPPTPPQPNRWQEKRTDRRDDVEAQAPAPSKPQAVHLSPRQMVADDKMYMIMQEDFLDIANTIPTPKSGSGNPARASQAEAAESSPESPSQKSPATTTKEEKRGKTKATRVEAGKMATRRPATPHRRRMPGNRISQVNPARQKKRRRRRNRHRSHPRLTAPPQARPAQKHRRRPRRKRNLTNKREQRHRKKRKRNKAVRNPIRPTLQKRPLRRLTYPL